MHKDAHDPSDKTYGEFTMTQNANREKQGRIILLTWFFTCKNFQFQYTFFACVSHSRWNVWWQKWVLEEWPTPASMIIVLFYFPHRCQLQRKRRKKENDCNARTVFESLDSRRKARRTFSLQMEQKKKKNTKTQTSKRIFQ